MHFSSKISLLSLNFLRSFISEAKSEFAKLSGLPSSISFFGETGLSGDYLLDLPSRSKLSSRLLCALPALDPILEPTSPWC